MSSITINNCNGASLPPLLLPRTVYNHGSQQSAGSAGRNAFSDYGYPPSEHGTSTQGKSYAKIKVGANYSYNYTTANSSSSLASLVRIPHQYNGTSAPVTANSSLDNLANLASVAVESLESGNRSLKRGYNEEPLPSHVSIRRAERRNSRKYSFRMSPPSAAASGLNSGSNSETTSGTTSGASSRASSRVSSRVTSRGTSRSSSSSRSRSKSPSLSGTFVGNSLSASANEDSKEDSKEDSLPINITGAKVIASSKCKRQRTGPSCDVCRSKKIKCDAMVVVIWQDSLLLSNCNRDDSLHRPFSIEDCNSSLLSKMPTEIRSQLSEHKDMSLVRHVDKLISFTSCSSCSKKKDCECNFSKGFTRNDIAVFSSLNKKLGKRNSLGDFTVQDYLDVGYSLD